MATPGSKTPGGVEANVRRSSRRVQAPKLYSPQETPVDDYHDSDYDTDTGTDSDSDYCGDGSDGGDSDYCGSNCGSTGDVTQEGQQRGLPGKGGKGGARAKAKAKADARSVDSTSGDESYVVSDGEVEYESGETETEDEYDTDECTEDTEAESEEAESKEAESEDAEAKSQTCLQARK